MRYATLLTEFSTIQNHTPLQISRDQLQMSFLWYLRWAKMARNNSLEYRLGALGNCGYLSLVQLAGVGWGRAYGVDRVDRKRVPNTMRLWSPKERKLRSFQVPQDPCMIIAFPTVGPEKEMVSSDTYWFHILLVELNSLGCCLRETWSLHHEPHRGLTLARRKPMGWKQLKKKYYHVVWADEYWRLQAVH